MIYIKKGEAEIIFKDEKFNLKENNALTCTVLSSYSIRAQLDCEILIISIIPQNNDIDSSALKKQIMEISNADQYTLFHSYRVSLYCSSLATALGINIGELGYASQFHDIGKIKISTNILRKNGKLTPEEYNEIKKHPLYSYEIIKEVFSETAANIALNHHERLDGSGYPYGKNKYELNICARILMITDIFDAITTDRPYHDGISFKEAINKMRIEEINRIDFSILDIFEHLIDSGIINEKEINNLFKDSFVDN